MRRREFIAFIPLIGGAAATCPMAARAQQSAMPVIGLLLSGTAADGGLSHVLAGFRAGLGETGYVEGKNVAIEYRCAPGQSAVLLELAARLAHPPGTLNPPP